MSTVHIKYADVLGFCMGVEKAIDIALKTAQGRQVHSLGPLIHNPEATAKLKLSGVTLVPKSDIGKTKVTTAIVSAHGITPALYKQLTDEGTEVVDATCPKVKASQRRAQKLHEQGYQVVIAGDAGHSEVIGLSGYAPDAIVVPTKEDAAQLADNILRSHSSSDDTETVKNAVPSPVAPSATSAQNRQKKLALIAQTTISEVEYTAIQDELRRAQEDLVVAQTICSCTRERLESLDKLSKEVKAVIVVGGRNSANTQRLQARALAAERPAWLVETAEDLPSNEELCGFGDIGITAGASTPKSQILRIAKAILNRCNDEDPQLTPEEETAM